MLEGGKISKKYCSLRELRGRILYVTLHGRHSPGKVGVEIYEQISMSTRHINIRISM